LSRPTTLAPPTSLTSSYTFFFFNDPAPTEIYTLSLHDALPISRSCSPATVTWQEPLSAVLGRVQQDKLSGQLHSLEGSVPSPVRSEEHTSELQSQSNLVCRLLLEKKKQPNTTTTPRVSRLRISR